MLILSGVWPESPSSFCHARSLLAAALPARGQDLITGISTLTTTVTGPATTSPDNSNYTFDRQQESLTGFTTSTGTYTVSGTSDYALVQRNGTPYQSSVWYRNVSATEFSGEHQNTYGALLQSNNFNQGSDNTFANNTGTGTPPNNVGNIERLDYTWRSSFSDLSTLSFAVFDRGNVGVHDAFTIALVTGIDVNGKPTSYGAAIRVAGFWGGSTNAHANFSYNLFRYSSSSANPDDVSSATSANENSAQGIGGLVIRASDFGALAPGTQVYGYSLMGADVDISDLSRLADVTSLDGSGNNVYPLNTDGGTGTGGIDLAAVNGLEIRMLPVPEPTVAALLAIGGGLAVMAALRRPPQE